MPQVDAGKAYWRSLNDLADTPEFRELVENEFPSRLDAIVDPVSRRRFVQLMGASFALAGLTGCDALRMPVQKILPFSRRPEGRDPGTTASYATVMELGGVGTGLLVTTYDGRPIKIEGNPEHPDSLGATSQYAQASVLSLYDPDRSQGVISRAEGGEPKPSSWDEFFAAVGPRLADRRAQKGLKVSVLAEATSSPTVQRLRDELVQACPRLRWYEYEPVSRDHELEGARMVLGGSYRTLLDLSRADVVVSLDDDLFGLHPANVRYSRDFAERRRRVDRDGSMNRLYVVETPFSITGGMADTRVALQSAEVFHFGLRLAAEVVRGDETGRAKLSKALRDRLEQLAAPADHPQGGLLRQMAADLLANRGRSVVAVGPRQPAVLHAIGHLLNGILGNVGATVSYVEEAQRPTYLEALQTLTSEMSNDRVDTLLILGGNPVYTAPKDVEFKAALERVTCSVHLGLYADETARECTWHLPMAHYLEAWGDARGYDGTVGLVQPTIRPLFQGKSPIELLAFVLGRDPKEPEQSHGYNLVRETYRGAWGGELEQRWRRALHDGVVAGSALPRKTPRRDDEPIVTHLASVPAEPRRATAEALELVLLPDHKLYDGRFANNGWLQELPDPLAKLTWDNAVYLDYATAARFEVKEGDLLQLKVREGNKERQLKAPAFPVPGLPEFTLTLALGYGRGEAAGVVGKDVGVDAYEMRTATHQHALQGVTFTKVGTYKLATTQDHQSIRSELADKERDRRATLLVREGTLEEFAKNPRFAKNPWDGGPTLAAGAATQHAVGPDPRKTQLWGSPLEYAGRRWGMAIDLSVCTGCSACVVACQAENNIPVVGKSEVARGREMHWLRIDRYFTTAPLAIDHPQGDPASEARAEEAETPAPGAVRIVHQPLPCMQCENAPCESVCPVAATSHSEEGLNDMVYNRCVGTRYCSNNCPYKVRRFNYFWNYHGPFHPRSEPSATATLPKFPENEVSKKLKLPMAKNVTPLEQMVFNPEVTVRARGVMEKCTYCVQRIKAVTIPWDNKHRDTSREDRPKIPDGAIQTACQQACPTRAIVFGDLSDPESEVSKWQRGDRSYSILAELNTRPRTQYMAKLRNPPPATA